MDLRTALLDFISETGRKRLVPTQFHLGTPGGEQIRILADDATDPGLRTDLVEQALGCLEAEQVLPWLTRHGELTANDADHAWCAASVAGFGRHELAVPGFFVVTRHGWLDVLTNEVVRFRRVRSRSRDTALSTRS